MAALPSVTCTPMKPLFTLAAALWACGTPALAASDAELARCRALAQADARLACYDALPIAAAPTPPAPMPVAKPAAPAPVPPVASFGLEQRSAAAQEQQVESRIDGLFEGWGPTTRIRLANGQVWQIADGSSGTAGLTNARVKVTRAMFGSFMLEIEGMRAAPRVRRVE